MNRRAPLALLGLLLLFSPAAAADAASVDLAKTGDAWNGRSVLALEPSAEAREVDVWVPANARIHDIAWSDGAVTERATWQAAGADALRVEAPAGATAVAVTFDIPERRPYLLRYVAPAGTDEVRLSFDVPRGLAVESPDAEFIDGAASARVAPGDVIAVRVVEAGRVGELPLLVTVGALAVVVLLGTLLWHRVRPPLEGREPQKLLEHLAELQARLVPPVVLFVLFNLFYFTSGLRVVNGFVVPTWGAEASVSARAFEAIAERLVPPEVGLVVLRPADAVLAQVGMGMFLAFVTVLPLLVYELAAFIGPGLESRERRVAMRVLPLVTGLFLAGALLAYLVMTPLMIRTLYGYAPGIGAAPLLAVGDLVSFSLLIILALGAAFELPVAMYVLARLGLVRAATFGRYVRHAILAIVVVAGIITPDPSVVSQLLLAVPIVALYALGIGAAALGERARPAAA